MKERNVKDKIKYENRERDKNVIKRYYYVNNKILSQSIKNNLQEINMKYFYFTINNNI